MNRRKPISKGIAGNRLTILHQLLLGGNSLTLANRITPLFHLFTQSVHALRLGLDTVAVLFGVIVRWGRIRQVQYTYVRDIPVRLLLAEVRDAVFVKPMINLGCCRRRTGKRGQ